MRSTIAPAPPFLDFKRFHFAQVFRTHAEAVGDFPRNVSPRAHADNSPAGVFVSDCGCVAGMISFSPRI